MSTRALLTALMLLAPLAAGCEDSPRVLASPARPTPLAPALDIYGEYTLTVTASPACSLPDQLRYRTYTARVTQQGSSVSAWLSGAAFTKNGDFLGGTRHGDVIDFDISWGWGFGVAELIDQTKVLYYEGTVRSTIKDGTIAGGTFNGLMRLYEDQSQMFTPKAQTLDCSATDHRMDFMRR